jgi:antitoxin MazE
MQAKVQKWGNSLAVRIPRSLAQQSRLGENSEVEMTIKNGSIVLVPIKPQKPSLQTLLDQVSDENLHGEVESDGPVGQEAW